MNYDEKILSDTPLDNPEDDRIRIAPFAKNLADMIIKSETDDSLVFALYGSWGSGKTTCINFIINYLNKHREDKRPIIVKFNPWWFSGQGELLAQFFREFRSALGHKDRFKEIAKYLEEFGKILGKFPEPTALLLGGFASLIFKNIGKYAEAWRLRSKIHKLLKKEKNKILVIIDDIDRLPGEEIRSVFRVIKAIADFPNTYYLIAFDKDVIRGALNDFQHVPGDLYLEKIVQIPFDLPTPDKKMFRSLFLEQIEVLSVDTPKELFDKTYWGNIFWDGIVFYLNSLRNVKRITNALKFTYPLVKGEANPVDFIAIEVIRICCNQVYKTICANPDMFTGTSDELSQNKKDELKVFHSKWLEDFYGEEKEVLKRLTIRLFPKLNSIFANTSYGSDWASIWRKQLRICSPDIFPIYFRLAISEDQISYIEMQNIMSLFSNEEKIKNRLLELSKQIRPNYSSRLRAFLERLQDYTEVEISIDFIPIILKALYDIGDELLIPEDEPRGLLEFGNDILIGRILFQLIRRYQNEEERYHVLKDAFSEGRAISMIVHEVISLGQQQGKYGAKRREESELIISAEHLKDLEEIALHKIKEFAKTNELIRKKKAAVLLYRWREWDTEEIVIRWVTDLISSDIGLVDFLTAFLSKSFSMGISDRVSKISWRLDPKIIEPFINPDKIIDRCRTLLKDEPIWLIGEKKISAETFIKWYDLRAKGKDPENRLDWEE